MAVHHSAELSRVPKHRFTFFSGIRARLLLLVLLAIVPPIVLVAYNALEARNTALGQAREEVKSFARLAVEQLSAEIYAASYMQRTLAQIPAVRHGVEPGCSDVLADLLQRTQRYTGLVIARRDGIVICSGQPRSGIVTYSDRRYFQDMLQSRAATVGKPVVGKISGRAQVPLAFPVFDANGEIDKVIVTGVDLAQFAASFAKSRQLHNAAFLIWDEAGSVFYRYPDKDGRVGATVPAALRSQVSDGTTVAPELDGVVRVYGTAALSDYPGVGIRVSVGLSESELVRPANSTLARSLILLGLVGGFALGVALLLSELYLRRRVAGLVASAERIAGGDLDIPIALASESGELGVLARAVETMRQGVRAREVELREAGVLYRTLFEQSPAGVVLIDPESLRPVAFNTVAHKQLCYTREEFGMLQISDYETFGAHEETNAWSARILSAGQDDFETRHRTKRGEFRHVMVSVRRVESGGRILFYCVYHDITEIRRAEELLRDVNAVLEHRIAERTRALEEANKELEAFSYSVSHDLRAPLRHINNYVEMLSEETGDQLGEEARRYLRVIADASRQMGALIDDLLEFSRMGRAEMHATRVDLNSLARETIANLATDTQERNIAWVIPPLPVVEGDPAMLRQVLANLMGNAVKYSRGRNPAQIEVGTAGEEDGRLVFYVRDNGVGFDMKYADKLFGVFRRLHRAEEFEGTGIGLANVQRILTRHGGRIWAEAAPDRGATFYFTLKLSASV